MDAGEFSDRLKLACFEFGPEFVVAEVVAWFRGRIQEAEELLPDLTLEEERELERDRRDCAALQKLFNV